MHVQAYLYQGYWEDIGTVEAFYESNLALTDNPAPKFRCLRYFLYHSCSLALYAACLAWLACIQKTSWEQSASPHLLKCMCTTLDFYSPCAALNRQLYPIHFTCAFDCPVPGTDVPLMRAPASTTATRPSTPCRASCRPARCRTRR